MSFLDKIKIPPCTNFRFHELSKEYSERIKPLLDEFNIALLNYSLLLPEGATFLYSDPDIMEGLFWNLGSFNINLCGMTPNNEYSWEHYMKPATVDKARELYNYQHGLYVLEGATAVKWKDRYWEAFAFAGHTKTPLEDLHYFYSREVREYCMNFIRHNCDDLIEEARVDPIGYQLHDPNMRKIIEGLLTKYVSSINFLKRSFTKKVHCLRGFKGDAQLSERELQTLKLILALKRNKQIASEFEISERAVDGIVNRLKEKLGCFTREQLYDIGRANAYLFNDELHLELELPQLVTIEERRMELAKEAKARKKAKVA